MDIEQARKLAKDETTAPEILRELANDRDAIVRQNVVMNPNIPPDVLVKLVEQFPKQVFNNPAIDLLLLETPNLFSGTSTDILCSLLKRKVPIKAIEYAANSSDERLKLAILMNPQTPSEILEELAKNKNQEIAEAAKLHINYSQDNNNNINKNIEKKINDILSNYAQFDLALSKWQDADISRLGKIQNLEFEPMMKYYEYLFKKDYSVAAISDFDIDKLSSIQSRDDFSKNKDYIKRIIENPTISINILEKISELDEYGYTDSSLVNNPNISAKIIQKIVKRCLFCIDQSKKNINTIKPRLNSILLNFITPLEIIEEIAEYPNYRIKSLVVNTIDIPEHIVKKLIVELEKNHDHYDLIEHLCFCENKFISSQLIEDLLSSLQEELKDDRLFLFEHKSQKRDLLSKIQVLAAHPKIKPDTLKKLAKHKDFEIRKQALLSPQIDKYITEEWGLSFIGELFTNELPSLASNIFISDNLLKIIIRRKNDNNYNYSSILEALSNPCISNNTILEWEKSHRFNVQIQQLTINQEKQLLDKWKSSLTDSHRFIILKNSQTPAAILAKVSRSTSWLERYAIAQNPKTPFPIIKNLAEDGNRLVRAATKARLEKKQSISLLSSSTTSASSNSLSH